MKKIKKRGAVYGVIALLLCAAAYLNWSYVDAPEGRKPSCGAADRRAGGYADRCLGGQHRR